MDLVLALCTFAATSVFATSPRVCELAVTRTGLAQSASLIQTDKDGNGFLAVDFDSDGALDELKWSVTGSRSIVPADNSTLVLTLRASGKRFTLEQQRLHVIEFESRYYAVTGWVESEQGPWHKEVFAFGREGITKICSFSGKGIAQ